MIRAPLVSIGITSYNRPNGLRRTLECITSQTYKNLEIIVSDNCSNDPAVQSVLHEYQQRDRRVNCIFQPENKGAAFNFKFVLEQATGDYFMWAADDDWWDTRFVEEAVAALEANPSAVACWSNVLFHREDNALTWPEPYHLYSNPDLCFDSKVTSLLKYHFQYGWYGIYALFRRDTIAKLFPRHAGESNLVFGSDVHFMTDVLLAGKVLKLNAPLFHYSTRQASSADYHLARMPFGQSSKQNPYLAQLLKIFEIVMRSSELTAFEKLLYCCRFLFAVLLKKNAWSLSISRYPCGEFYRTLLREGKIKEFFMLVTVGIAVTGHKALAKLLRSVRKIFSAVRLATVGIRQLDEVIKFAVSLPSKPRVLIIEPNICHAEFTIGIANYLNQLGYNCQFLVSSEIGKENPFCRIPKGFSTVHYLEYPLIIRIITSRFISLYDFAILSSSFDYRKMIPFSEIYKFRHKPKNGMLFIEHDLQNVVSVSPILYQAYEAKRLLVLTNYHDDEKLTEIEPCFFGDIKTRDKKKSHVSILVPGSNSQNVGLLMLTAKTLVDKGFVNFELNVVGAPANERARAVAESMGINKYVKMLGRVDFPTLYREIEESDFLVGPQDVSSYLNRKTSGSKLLSIGFLKPLIAPDEIAAAWGFDASKCISYSVGQVLVGAIEHALLMQGEEYRQLVGLLRVARANVERDSLLKLGKLLSELTLASSSAET